MGIIGLSMPVFLYVDYWKTKKLFFIHLILAGSIASSGMVYWQVRNWNIAKVFVGLHPIYYPENSVSCYRPTHEALWGLCKGWGEVGANFHSYVDPFWNSAIDGNPSDEDIDKIISQFPEEVVKELKQDRLRVVLRNYQQTILYQKHYYDNKIPMPKTLSEMEIKTIAQLKELTTDFKKHFWFQYYIVSPLNVFKELAFHSNLSLYIFQFPFRGNFFMEAFRLFCFIIHSLAFTTLAINLFFKKPIHLKSVFSYSIIIYVCYLVFIQRGIEERYTLPILSLALLSFGHFLIMLKSLVLTGDKQKIVSNLLKRKP